MVVQLVASFQNFEILNFFSWSNVAFFQPVVRHRGCRGCRGGVAGRRIRPAAARADHRIRARSIQNCVDAVCDKCRTNLLHAQRLHRIRLSQFNSVAVGSSRLCRSGATVCSVAVVDGEARPVSSTERLLGTGRAGVANNVCVEALLRRELVGVAAKLHRAGCCSCTPHRTRRR